MESLTPTNLTIWEEETLEEFNPEFESYLTSYHTVFLVVYITNIIKFIVSVFVIAADIFLIVIIYKNPKLKSKKTNSYLIHFAICNIIAIIAAPIFYILSELLQFHISFAYYTYFCLDLQVETAGLGMCFLLGIGLCIDWLINVYNSNWKLKYDKVYKYSILICYIIGIIKFCITLGFCFNSTGSRFFFTFFIVSIMLTNIFFNVLNYRLKSTTTNNGNNNNNKKAYALSAANVIILSWLPMFIYEMLWIMLSDSQILSQLIIMIGFIPEWIGYGSPILLLFILSKNNKRFKKAFDRALKRSLKDYNDEEDLDDSDDEIETVEASRYSEPPDAVVI